MIEYTVKEYAYLERVDERTVRRWYTEKGALTIRRTPGGGVRIILSSPHPNDRRAMPRLVEIDARQIVQSADSRGHLSR